MVKLPRDFSMPSVKLGEGLAGMISEDPSLPILAELDKVIPKADMKVLRSTLHRLNRRIVEPGWIHVSDALSNCQRQMAAAYLGYKTGRAFSPASHRIMDNGTYAHLRYYTYFSLFRKPWKVKAPVVLRKWPLVGEADVIVAHPEYGQSVLELKTINLLAWRELTEPLPNHGQQLNSYLALAGLEAGQVWYENKNNQQLKTFLWDFDWLSWNRQWEKVNDVMEHVSRGILPDCQCSESCQKVEITAVAVEAAEKAKELWLSRSSSLS